MVKLKTTWIVDDLIDYEYKTYKILDYLQKVQYKFEDYELYPYFTELIQNYNIVKQLKMRGSINEKTYGNNLNSLELTKFKAKYERCLEIDVNRDKINKTLNFAIDEMRPMVMLGKELYENVKKSIKIESLINDKFIKKGYILIKNDKTYVYEYKISKIKPNEDPINKLKTKLISVHDTPDKSSLEELKMDVLKNSKITKPNLYLVTSAYTYPIDETMTPVVKRVMLKNILK